MSVNHKYRNRMQYGKRRNEVGWGNDKNDYKGIKITKML